MPIQNSEDLSEYFNCIRCGQCCNYFEMIVNPQNIRIGGLYVNKAFKNQLDVDFDEIQQCSIRINTKCSHLDTKTGLCLIHDNRPEICRNHFCQRYPKIEEEEN